MPPETPSPTIPSPVFHYRDGIGMRGTPITCDGPGYASDLVFLGNAHTLSGKELAKLTRSPLGRRQLLATAETLSLLGKAGDGLRPRLLPVSFGRPFTLGALRIEVIPSGYLPGAAGLFVEGEGVSFLHMGRLCRERLWDGVEPAGMRRAKAVCLSATFADPRIVFPPRRQVLDDLRDFAGRAAAEGKPVVLFVSPNGPLDVLAKALAPHKTRAHSALLPILESLAAFDPSPPRVVRFADKLSPGEILLWPAREWNADKLANLAGRTTAWVSGHAADPTVIFPPAADRAFPLSNQASHAELIRMVLETGCEEVALYQGHAEAFAETLRTQGLNAYTLESPRQMSLLDTGA